MASKTERRKINRERVRGAANERKKGGGLSTISLPEGVEFFSLNQGKNAFDILPYEVTVGNHPEVKKGDLWYERTFWLHRDVGPEEKSFVCPLKTAGQPCPVCEEYNKLKKDKDADKAVLDALRPKKRQLFAVVDKGPKASGDIQVLEISYYCFGKHLDTLLSDEDYAEFAGFADLEGGFTLRVIMGKEAADDFSYLSAARVDFAPRKRDYPEAILDDVPNLDTVLKIPTYEQMDAAFNGVEVEEEQGGATEEEEPPTAPRGAGRGRKAPEPEAAEEETPGDEAEPCKACEGTGKNSKGKVCLACGGTGTKDDPGGESELEAPPEEEPPAEEEPPPARGAKKGGRKAPPPESETTGDGSAEDGWGDDSWD